MRALASILHRLESLSFTESQNAQIPYLLRAVIPKGLPNLKSLEFYQDQSNVHLRDLRNIEGSMWYEKPNGTFEVVKTRKEAARTVTDNFMNSIVRGAPNLVELAIHCPCFLPGYWVRAQSHFCILYYSLTGICVLQEVISPYLVEFPSFQRFYAKGFHIEKDKYPFLPKSSDTVAAFLSIAETLAKECPHLDMVTSMSSKVLPYLAAKIERNSEGGVRSVRRVAGVGLRIPEDELDPFPFNP